MKKIVLFLLFCTTYSFGQIALQQDNFSGVNAAFLNPSAIADSRWGIHFNIGLGSFIAAPEQVGLVTIPYSKEKIKLHDNTYGVNQADILGPSVQVQFRNKHAFAITSRYRASQQFSGGYDLFQFLRGESSAIPARTSNVSWNSNAFSEYGFSYAAPVYDRDNHFLKVGATFKLLKGWQSAAVDGSGTWGNAGTNLTYTLNNFTANHSDLTLKPDLEGIFVGKTPGKGSGFDIGVTYEFRPKADSYRYRMDGKIHTEPFENKYLLRIGLSLLDVGSLRYNQLTTYQAGNLSGTLDPAAYQALSSVDAAKAQVVNDFSLSSGSGETTQKLPQKFVAQADLKMGKGLYMSGAWVNSPRDNGSVVMLGPRVENMGTGISLSAFYYTALQKLTVGATFRLGIFIVGSDNLLGLFKDNGLAPRAFGGLVLPLSKAKRQKDRDGDYVSDRKDKCKDIQGVWQFQGCPDTDRDGIPDREDQCPEEAGPKESKGCPDTDKDGIYDKNDACPTEPGPAKYNGCPDTDNDGIPNSEDECPTVAGTREMGGCPDTDKDGIKDSDDQCPNTAGLKELDGCALENRSTGEFQALTQPLLASYTLSRTLKQQIQTLKNAQPGRKLTLTFSGENQEVLVRLAGLYKDALTQELNESIEATVQVVAGQKPGLALELLP